MSTAKKLGIAAAILFVLWIIKDPISAADSTGEVTDEVESGLDAIPVFLSNVFN